VILVANTVLDGLTISPSSTIPGNNDIIQSITVSAPGTDIKSTIPIVSEEKFKELCPEMDYNDTGMAILTGTSMAAPQVTGLAAILMAMGAPIEKIAEIIRSTCSFTDRPDLFGCGNINFDAAI